MNKLTVTVLAALLVLPGCDTGSDDNEALTATITTLEKSLETSREALNEAASAISLAAEAAAVGYTPIDTSTEEESEPAPGAAGQAPPTLEASEHRGDGELSTMGQRLSQLKNQAQELKEFAGKLTALAQEVQNTSVEARDAVKAGTRAPLGGPGADEMSDTDMAEGDAGDDTENEADTEQAEDAGEQDSDGEDSGEEQ